MKTLPLGNTGVNVSALCFGAMFLGTKEDKDVSYSLLDYYHEASGRFIDTANIYAHWVGEPWVGGESETLLGQWMNDRNHRHDIFLATKMGLNYPGVEQGLRAHQIEAECEKSLKRLQTDTIDLYYAHHDDLATPYEETLEAFSAFSAASAVQGVGWISPQKCTQPLLFDKQGKLC